MTAVGRESSRPAGLLPGGPAPSPRDGDRRATDAAVPPFTERGRHRAGDAVTAVAASHDQRRIAAVTADRRLHLLDGDGRPLWRSPELPGQAWRIALSADGGRIAVGGVTHGAATDDGACADSLTVFDGDGDELFHQAYAQPVSGIAMSPDGRGLAVALRSGTLHFLAASGPDYRPDGQPVDLGDGCGGITLLDGPGQRYAAATHGGVRVTGPGRPAGRPLPAGPPPQGVAPRAAAPAVVADGAGGLRLVDVRGGAWSPVAIPGPPVCAVSATPDACLVLAGENSGRVLLTGRRAQVYWTWSGEGEVWSTALSHDGALAVIGGSDGTVTVLANRLTRQRLSRLEAMEQSYAGGGGVTLPTLLARYSGLGLLVYGHRHLTSSPPARSGRGPIAVDAELAASLRDYLAVRPEQVQARQLLGDLLAEAGHYREALGHYQRAAADTDLAPEALLAAGRCFQALDMPLAARVSQDRVHRNRMERGGLIALYNLAGSYETRGDLAEARSVYETIAGWDADYRDTMRRITALPPAGTVPDRAIGEPAPPDGRPAAERGGHADPVYRAHLLRGGSLVDGVLGKLASAPQLRATLASYFAYDFAPPSDEVKKWLDIVHSIAFIQEAKLSGTSLDIGTATARYPRMLKKLGFRSFGLDIEFEAVRYARSSRLYTDDPVSLVVGDASRLAFASGSIDLLTCMMGTLSHIPRPLLPKVLAEAARVLKPGGYLVTSNWDPDSRLLDFLTMYTPAQTDVLRRNLRGRTAVQREVERAGLEVVRIEPFCVFPSFVGYDVGRKRDHTFELRRLVDLDLAYQTSPDAHGQMFMLAARNPG